MALALLPRAGRRRTLATQAGPVPWHLLRPSLPRPAHEVNALLRHAKRIDAVLLLHEEHAAHFDQIHVATMWGSVGRLARVDESQRAWIYDNEDGAFAAGRQTTVRLAGRLEPPSIATSAGGIWLAGLGYSPAWDETWRRLESAALSRLGELSEFQLTHLVGAYAALPERTPHARQRILDGIAVRLTAGGRAAARPGGRSPHPPLELLRMDQIVSVARAYATARHDAPELCRLIILRAARSTGELPLPQLTGLLQAVTRLGLGPEAVEAGLFDVAVRALERMDNASLAGVAWSLAHAQRGEPDTYEQVARLATRRMHSFLPVDLAVLAHAFSSAAALGNDEIPPGYALSLFDQLASHATAQAERMGPYELTSVAHAFAKAEAAGWARPAEDLFRAIGAAASHQLHAFSAHELSMLAHAMASVSRLDDPLLADLADEIGPRLHTLKPRELVALAVAIRASGSHARVQGLLSDLGTQLHERQAELTDAERITVLSAFQRMRLPPPVDVIGPADYQ
jgi:hypothetical protein